MSPKFSPERFTVIARKGTRLVAKNRYHMITKNISHIKKVNRYETTEEEDNHSDGEANNTNPKLELDIQNREENQQPRFRGSQRSRIPIPRFGTLTTSNLIT